ncbi:MAG TPA: DNA repair and recombination protein RadA [Candidatus Nanoarchaeia archaeon]|nr:DNA repair and recombination protein RadA [Candidatus Nanoarchaeia archaeon]
MKQKLIQMEQPQEEMPKEKTLYDLPGVGPATAEKLEQAGFTDLMSVAVATPGELMDAAGLTEVGAKKIIVVARASLQMGFESGADLLKRRSNVIKLSSSSKELDKLMAGGFETGCITEVYGAYGSSKTQIAHQLAVNVQLPKDQGGAEGEAVYIDTENTFRPERITQMAKGMGLDPEKVLENIKVARAFNSDHQMILAEKVEDLIKKGVNVRLVVVDSMTAHFRAEFIGRGTLAERQQKINKHMHVLQRLADRYNFVVLVTNQVMARPDMFFGDPTEAIGGHIVGHNSTFRIYLRRGKKGSRVAKLVDAPNLPEGEAVFQVLEEGIRDL